MTQSAKPSVASPAATQNIIRYYFKVEIDVAPGKMPAFILATRELLAYTNAQGKWKLLAALSAITGTPSTVLHLWELTDANALLEGMQFLASDEVQRLYAVILASSTQHRQDLFTAMQYNPLGANVVNTSGDTPIRTGPQSPPSRTPGDPTMADDPNDNLIVYVNPDPNNPTSTSGGLYTLPKSVYTNPAYAYTGIPAAPAWSLLSLGTVVANIPDDGTGVGGYCYLVNLPALQPPPVGGAPTAAATAARPKLTAAHAITAMAALLANTDTSQASNADQATLATLQGVIGKGTATPTPSKK
jgi:hypothetical protein